MDFIGAALERLKVSVASVGRSEVCAPWEIRGGEGLPAAYLFLRGQGKIVLEGQKAHRIEAGDLVLVTRGDTHRLHDGAASPESAGRSDFLYVTVRAGISKECPFVSALPLLLVLGAAERAAYPHLDTILQGIIREYAASGPASELVLARLWEMTFLLAFRSYLSQDTEHTTGWLAAIRDPQMAKVLGAIQQRPSAPWTVEGLAEEASMSRATLIRQFVRVMGDPPMKFLYLHRMGIAASLLTHSERSLAEVAAHVGYGSEAAFSNAFRRRYGCAPGAYRTRHTPTA
jgi:AraC-like DNA-binding protein